MKTTQAQLAHRRKIHAAAIAKADATTQGARLVGYIRRFWELHNRGPTYLDLLVQCYSTCPWKRLAEPGAQAALKPGERIVRGMDARGRVTFQITTRAKRG